MVTDPPGGSRGRPSSSYSSAAGVDVLARTLSDVARSLQHESGLQDTLDNMVTAAVHTVPGAQHAGIMIVSGRRHIATRAATDELAREVDRAQYLTGQGPCLEAIHQHRTVRLTDMAQEERWPDFTRRALALGVRSMLSFQMYVTAGDLGALNLFSREPDAFGDESEDVGLLFAAHAAVAMAGAQREQDLVRAVSARDMIGQAKGILMERHRMTGDQAFRVLVRASQQANVKLVEVAEYLVRTGDLGDQNRL